DGCARRGGEQKDGDEGTHGVVGGGTWDVAPRFHCSAVGSAARIRWTASEPLAVQPAGRRRYGIGATRRRTISAAASSPAAERLQKIARGESEANTPRKSERPQTRAASAALENVTVLIPVPLRGTLHLS